MRMVVLFAVGLMATMTGRVVAARRVGIVFEFGGIAGVCVIVCEADSRGLRVAALWSKSRDS